MLSQSDPDNKQDEEDEQNIDDQRAYESDSSVDILDTVKVDHASQEDLNMPTYGSYFSEVSLSISS